MNNNDLLNRIELDANVSFGKPHIKGTRISVSDILEYLAGGTTNDELLELFPQLKEEDIRACFAYAANGSNRTSNVQ